MVDLGSLEELPDRHASRASPSSSSRRCPACDQHSCSRGRRGGFVERLHEGTWLGHVAEHVALQLQQEAGHDIRRGKTRQVKGEPGRYNVIYGYVDESVGLAAGRARRPAGQPPRAGRPRTSTSTTELETFIMQRRADARSARRPRRSSTRRSPATSRGSGSTRPRLVQLGQGVHAKRIRATMTSETGVDRGRHRLATRTSPPGCSAPPACRCRKSGVGAHGRRGGRGRAAGSATRSSVKPLDGNHGRGVCLDLQNDGRACARRSRSRRSSPGAAS